MAALWAQNNISELFNLLSFLEPKKFGGGLEDIQAEFGHLSESKQVLPRAPTRHTHTHTHFKSLQGPDTVLLKAAITDCARSINTM